MSVIEIQKIWRGYLQRKMNKKLCDFFTINMVIEYIDFFNRSILFIDEMNKKLKNEKVIRLPNYPSEITENIVKFAICKGTGFMPNWNTKKGDLVLLNKQIEVKGSVDLLNGGPSSFGPTENWDIIYFIDCVNSIKKEFKIWKINLSNTSDEWKQIKVNKNETYYDQCLKGRRPRINFPKIIGQIPKKFVSIIFDGHINSLIF